MDAYLYLSTAFASLVTTFAIDGVDYAIESNDVSATRLSNVSVCIACNKSEYIQLPTMLAIAE